MAAMTSIGCPLARRARVTSLHGFASELSPSVVNCRATCRLELKRISANITITNRKATQNNERVRTEFSEISIRGKCKYCTAYN